MLRFIATSVLLIFYLIAIVSSVVYLILAVVKDYDRDRARQTVVLSLVSCCIALVVASMLKAFWDPETAPDSELQRLAPNSRSGAWVVTFWVTDRLAAGVVGACSAFLSLHDSIDTGGNIEITLASLCIVVLLPRAVLAVPIGKDTLPKTASRPICKK